VRDPDWDFHCTDHAIEHILKTTGRDVWRELGGAPRNTKQAAALFRRLKVRSLKNAVTKVLGKPIDFKLAMRGDIVMVDNALGICRGDLIECLDRMQPIGRGQCAWRLK
jgi:hypothetical protein